MNPYTYESIGNGISVCVSKAHTFGTDSFLLADFANPKPKDNAVDLGTGCGIIPLLWLRGNAPARVVGVDIQPDAIQQLQRSIQRSQLEDRLVALEANLTEIKNHLGAGSADLVTCNPPYSAPGTGIQSPTGSRSIARHETLCTIDDVCSAAAWLLRTGGRFSLCQLPERLVDVLTSMRKHRIEPKRIRMVQQQADSAPWLVLVEGKRNAKPSVILEPPLIMREGSQPSNDMNRIYSLYGRL